jgi:hypothetical protein
MVWAPFVFTARPPVIHEDVCFLSQQLVERRGTFIVMIRLRQCPTLSTSASSFDNSETALL